MTPDHGTRACYLAGCRRPECRRANTAYHQARRDVHGRVSSTGVRWLPVTCWCEHRVVHVRRTDVLAGRTATCGLADCRPELLVAA
jgi:hypothetical protein